jgi:nitrogen PTS system EIIA component
MTAKINNIVRFSSLFTPKHVICRTNITNRDELLHEMLRKLALVVGIGDTEDAYQSLLDRENEIPSVVGPGIAMPHVRLSSINHIIVGIATSQLGIKYAPNITPPVKLIIMTLAPKIAPGAYLQAMSSLAKICQTPATADNVAALDSVEKVWEFFDQEGTTLKEHLRASDIMGPVTVKLQEHDTLEKAIDLFVRHQVRDVPVVDKDDDLIGVVSTHELLKVCLPDYILWIEDLTPIINFEPFAEILRKESKTWLTEIMTTDYATVIEDALAAQVAKEFAKQKIDHVYVLREKKLVGVVSLAMFLNKILRE